jgi:hypothetical protein
MTYKVVLNGEEIISGKTTLDGIWAPGSKSVSAYMKRVAKRTRMLHPDRQIRTGPH